MAVAYPKWYMPYEPVVDYIPSYAKGGYVYTQGEYYVPSVTSWVFKRVYSNKDTGETVEVTVHADGTIHLSQDAFDALMRDKGFVAAGGTIGQS